MSADKRQDVFSRISPEEVARLTYDLVRIPSETGHEGEVSRFFNSYLNGVGIPSRLQHVQEDRPNVIGELKGAGGGENLLLYGHIDTIPWGVCVPASMDKNVVWGRGSSDMKSSLAAVAVAAKAINEAGLKLKGTVWIAAGVGHEVTWPIGSASFPYGDGPRRIAQSIREGEIKPDYCIVTEGPLDSVKVAQGGQAVYRITVGGGPGAVHTSSFPIERSTGVWAGETLMELYSYCKVLETRKSHPLCPSTPRLEIGVVSGGDFFNRNPGQIEIVGCIRWDPDWTIERVEQDFSERLEGLRQRLAAKYGDETVNVGLDFIVVRDACDSAADPRTLDLAERIQKVAQPIVGQMRGLSGSRAVDDIGIFYKEAGVPTVCYGPSFPGIDDMLPEGVNVGRAHSDNEGQPISLMYKVAQVYAGIMLDVCGVAE